MKKAIYKGTIFLFIANCLLPTSSFSQGTRIWATYYGETGEENNINVATDASGNVYLAGYTDSSSGIASGGFQNTYGGGSKDDFFVKFNAAGTRQWATY